MRDGREDSEIPFTDVALGGAYHVVTTALAMPRQCNRPHSATEVAAIESRKRAARARYSAIQDPHPAFPKFRTEIGTVLR